MRLLGTRGRRWLGPRIAASQWLCLLVRPIVSGSTVGNPALPPLVNLDDPEAIARLHHVAFEANWLVPGRVLLGRHPGRPQVLEKLGIRGKVATIVSLVEDKEDKRGEREQSGWLSYPYADVLPSTSRPAELVRFPIVDMQAATSLEALSSHVDELRRRVLAADADTEIMYSKSPRISNPSPFMYWPSRTLPARPSHRGPHPESVHCWGGVGRSGLVAACLLGALYDVKADEALARVQAYYRTRGTAASPLPAHHLASPETEPQREQVRAYFQLRGGAALGAVHVRGGARGTGGAIFGRGARRGAGRRRAREGERRGRLERRLERVVVGGTTMPDDDRHDGL